MRSTSDSDQSNSRVLASTLAGSWYPATADELDTVINDYLSKVSVPAGEAIPNVLVLPHAGYAYSAQTAAFAIKRILNAPFKRVVLLAPSHRVAMTNQFAAPIADMLSTPYGAIPVDRKAIETVARAFSVIQNNRVHANEHSAQIQYPLLQFALKEFSIVPFIVGEMSRSTLLEAANALRQIIDSKTLLIVSSDFTHYGKDFGYAPYGNDARDAVQAVDTQAAEKITCVDCAGFLDLLNATGATICGRNPIAVLLSMLPPDARLTPLHYETSSDTSGDYSQFVCYLSMAGSVNWTSEKINETPCSESCLTDDEKRKLLKFARQSIQHILKTGRKLHADHFKNETTPNLRQPMGCFVTLNRKTDHTLRGCMGEITARLPLYQAVTNLAGHAAFADPRFRELQKDEVHTILIEISVLTQTQSVNDWRDIVVGQHGVTIRKHGHTAVFLPQVAPEQGWTQEETLTHLALKAGLGPNDWRHDAQFNVFEAIVFSETD